MDTIDVRIKLSTLWLFVVLSIIFGDADEFALKPHLERLLTGRYNSIAITDELVLLGTTLAQLPTEMVSLSVLVMVLPSVFLRRKSCRPVTVFAVSVATAGMVSNAPTDLDDALRLPVMLAAMVSILCITVTWRLNATCIPSTAVE